MNLQHTMQSHW